MWIEQLFSSLFQLIGPLIWLGSVFCNGNFDKKPMKSFVDVYR
jgi:hypothetical protein